MILLPVDEIRYFQAEHKYVTVGHPKQRLLIEESLKSLEAELRTLIPSIPTVFRLKGNCRKINRST